MKNMSLNLINTQYILIESKESKVTATFKQFGTLGLHFEIERMTVWFNSSRVFRFFWSKESWSTGNQHNHHFYLRPPPRKRNAYPRSCTVLNPLERKWDCDAYHGKQTSTNEKWNEWTPVHTWDTAHFLCPYRYYGCGPRCTLSSFTVHIELAYTLEKDCGNMSTFTVFLSVHNKRAVASTVTTTITMTGATDDGDRDSPLPDAPISALLSDFHVLLRLNVCMHVCMCVFMCP